MLQMGGNKGLEMSGGSTPNANGRPSPTSNAEGGRGGRAISRGKSSKDIQRGSKGKKAMEQAASFAIKNSDVFSGLDSSSFRMSNGDGSERPSQAASFSEEVTVRKW